MSEIFSSDWIRDYARIVLNIGVNLQKEQMLFIDCDLAARELCLAIVEEAYMMGSGTVTVIYDDQDLFKSKAGLAPGEVLEFPELAFREAAVRIAKKNGAVLKIIGNDPENLSGLDSDRKAAAMDCWQKERSVMRDIVMNDVVNWNATVYPTEEMAASIFPGLPPGEARKEFASHLHRMMRLDHPDPVDAWHRHVAALRRRTEQLNSFCFHALEYRGPGTELTIGLADNHVWTSAEMQARNGVFAVANLPTEEVFTTPDCRRADGRVRSSRPLIAGGTNVGLVSFEIRHGRIVSETAEHDADVLCSMLDLDERSRYLGEVALVPENSPVAQADTVFKSTLIDENAGCHIAFGSAYSVTVKGAEGMTADERQEAGINQGNLHQDFVIGSPELDVTGILPDGGTVPVMRKGLWYGEFAW